MPQKGWKKSANTAKNGAILGFEGKLWATADKLRGAMEPSDYKHIVLGLIFLKYISDRFEARYAELMAEHPEDAEDKDAYTGDSVFWVPKQARWKQLQNNAKDPKIGLFIDEAMREIEDVEVNKSLRGVLPKEEYAKPALNPVMLGELVDLVSGIHLGADNGQAGDVLGRVYEYFLGNFAGAEGKRGGEFYTPNSVVRLLVEMLQPYQGRIYDPCCGSSGMFVQSEKFVKENQGGIGDIAIYGQERNHTTWRLSKMNLAVRGIDAEKVLWNSYGSFHKDEFSDERFEFILANPPFNLSDWGGEKLHDDPRWAFGAPPPGNANFAWLQHIYHHLAPGGAAGVVLANGSMSSNTSGEGDIRKAMIKAGVVDCMIALPGQLFYYTQIPACLWFLRRPEKNGGARKRADEILFIDARKCGRMVDRTRRELTDDEITDIAETRRRWRDGGDYTDIPGFCKAAGLDEIHENGYVLTPGRYVGVAEVEDDGVPFDEKMASLTKTLGEQMRQARALDDEIKTQLAKAGFKI